MYTEYTILQKMQSDSTEEQLILNAFKYNHFRMAWYSFVQLLDIDYSERFCCASCGVSPNTLIMDGTSLSFRRALDSWNSSLGPVPSKDEGLRQGR